MAGLLDSSVGRRGLVPLDMGFVHSALREVWKQFCWQGAAAALFLPANNNTRMARCLSPGVQLTSCILRMACASVFSALGNLRWS